MVDTASAVPTKYLWHPLSTFQEQLPGHPCGSREAFSGHRREHHVEIVRSTEDGHLGRSDSGAIPSAAGVDVVGHSLLLCTQNALQLRIYQEHNGRHSGLASLWLFNSAKLP